ADGEVRRDTLLRGDRRRIETEPAGSKRGAGEGARPSAAVEITRLDKGAIWRLDQSAKQYEAMPFQRVRGTGGHDAEAPPAHGLLREHFRPGEAEITIGKPAPAGMIAGFATERVRATRVVPLRSATTAREARVELAMDAWITRDPRILEEVSRFERGGGDGPEGAESVARIRTGSGALIGGLAPHVRA